MSRPPVIIAQIHHTDPEGRDTDSYTIAAVDRTEELRSLIQRETQLIHRAQQQHMRTLAQFSRRQRTRMMEELTQRVHQDNITAATTGIGAITCEACGNPTCRYRTTEAGRYLCHYSDCPAKREH